jgi:hypothetical protein
VEDDDDGGQTVGRDAPRFFVYEVDPALPGDHIAERTPNHQEVEKVLAQGKLVGPVMTWAAIFDRYASPEFTKGSPPRIRRDVLPLALKHQGLVLLRRRASAKGNKGYQYPYRAPWINRANDRAMHVEQALDRFRAEQVQDARQLDRFSGTAYGGAASSSRRMTEADVHRMAHEKYDRYLARLDSDAEEAAAPERERRAAIARQLGADAAAIREAHLAARRPPRRRVVRPTEDSGDSSSSLSSSDDEEGRP